MRLLALHSAGFAGIVEADIDFCPGLNVLYGPNDLGKSTLADSIRLALLLPHTSTSCEPFVPWTGGRHPTVELTFQSEPQRIWRLRKVFGRSGSSTLSESRDNKQFDEVARGRHVDGRIREILRWGIPEPGGAGGGRGIPASFLATALLSTQANVAAVLEESLAGDPTQSGKERIAAAVQAVAQDPLFLALLRTTQERRDEAYTEKGAKKSSKDSPFRKASDRLRELREERERWQTLVEESQGVEHHLRQLMTGRARLEARVGAAAEQYATLERLARQAAESNAAAARVGEARDAVVRIQRMDADVAAAEQTLADLARKELAAEAARAAARTSKREADAAVDAALATASSAGTSPEISDTVARQGLELRQAAAAQLAADAGRRIELVSAAKEAFDNFETAEAEHGRQVANVERAARLLDEAVAQEKVAEEQLTRLELLESAHAVTAAEEQLADARSLVARAEDLGRRRVAASTGLQDLEARRAALIVPSPGTLASMRRLATDLAAAKAALDVGLVVTVTAPRPIALRVVKDGGQPELTTDTGAVEIEATAAVDLDIGEVATVNIRGGRLEAQRTVQAFERRWAADVVPHLQAANASNLEALDARVAASRQLDSMIETKAVELRSLDEQISSLGDPTQVLQDAEQEADRCRASLGAVPSELLARELATLGRDSVRTLRERKESAMKTLAAGRAKAAASRTAHAVAEANLVAARSMLDVARTARESAHTAFPEGIENALTGARASLAEATDEQRRVTGELASLQEKVAAEHARIESAVASARAAAAEAQRAVETAESQRATAIADRASQVGRLEELRRLRAAQDLPAAEEALRIATEHQSALPVPERTVGEPEVAAARQALEGLQLQLAGLEGEIHKAHGALEQVGGAVARERLRDVIEAYELAERSEQEIEEEFEAWKLLLDQMKLADAAEASNLGQVLAPAIAGRFEALTQNRYESVRLTAQLGTDGVVVRGAVRSTARLSVGTREQLSTLYRVALAEYLGTTLLLDDQLVQSDNARMDWFRELLTEKARTFQIVVLTCRPEDYLTPDSIASTTTTGSWDAADGLVRAIDLGRAIRRG